MKTIIWGAGNIGKAIVYSLSKEWELLCFVDSDQNKIGKEFCNKEIRDIDYLSKIDFDALIIANTQGKSIRKYMDDNFQNKLVIDYLFEGSFDQRLCTLHLLIEEIEKNNIEGSVAEAGVFKGFFTHYINRAFKHRKLFLFDTFEGFAKQDILNDTQNKLTQADSHLFNETSIQEVRAKLLYPQNVVFKKGYFPDTTQDLQDERYCFVSIDFDLYTPTKEALYYFYRNLSKGGYIMIHDYNNDDFKGVKKALHELVAELGFSYVPISDGGGSIVIAK